MSSTSSSSGRWRARTPTGITEPLRFGLVTGYGHHRPVANTASLPLAREASEDMTVEREADQTREQQQRDPLNTLEGCERILILGRTGSGKTTLARELAAALGVPHVELDSLYFGPDFSRAPLSLLRERTSAAIAGDRWVTDGNKRAVRDLVWPRADTIIWLDYPVYLSLWRLAKRARIRTSALSAQAAQTGRRTGLPKQMLAAARGVLTALRSHRGQRRYYPRMFAQPANQHLAVARLRSPRATRRWMARVTEGSLG